MREIRFEAKVPYPKEFTFNSVGNEKPFGFFFNRDDVVPKLKSEREVVSKKITRAEES